MIRERPMDGDVHLSVNGAKVPVTDVHALYPDMDRASVEQLSVKVDRLMRRYDSELGRLMDQYDAIIENPHFDHALKVKAIQSKTMLLRDMASDASRIALAAERERRIQLEKARTKTQNKAVAVRLLEHSRKAARVADVYANPEVAARRPKVRMYAPGQKWVASMFENPSEPEM